MGRVGTTEIPYTPIVLEEGVVSCGSDGTTGAETGFHEFLMTFDYKPTENENKLIISITNTISGDSSHTAIGYGDLDFR